MHDAVIKWLFVILLYYLNFYSLIVLSKDDTSKCCIVYEHMFMIRSSVQRALNQFIFRMLTLIARLNALT